MEAKTDVRTVNINTGKPPLPKRQPLRELTLNASNHPKAAALAAQFPLTPPQSPPFDIDPDPLFELATLTRGEEFNTPKHIAILARDMFLGNEFESISPEELFKLFIDAERWEDTQSQELIGQGKDPGYRFDIREPGYMAGMMRATFLTIFQHPYETPITPELIEEWHGACVDGVSDKNGPLHAPLRKRSDGYEGFGLVHGETLSKDGLAELKAKVERYIDPTDEAPLFENNYFKLDGIAVEKPILDSFQLPDEQIIPLGKYLHIFDGDDQHPLSPTKKAPAKDRLRESLSTDFPNITKTDINQINIKINVYLAAKKAYESPRLVLQKLSTEHAKTCIQVFLDEYYTNIQGEDTEEKKLDTIILLCQNLDQLHPFTDGNIRLFGMALINYLLINNDLRPTCLYDPNCLDLLSIAEIKALVKEGQARFQKLKT